MSGSNGSSTVLTRAPRPRPVVDPSTWQWLRKGTGQLNRRMRRAALGRLRPMSKRGGAHICQMPTGAEVVVAPGSDHSHVSGISRCASAWSCPVCAPVIRERRAREIDDALVQHLENGGSAFLLTLTLQHHAGDSLKSLISELAGNWRKLQRRKVWSQARAEYGLFGSVRSLEMTWSPEHGWHPHIHLLIFGDRSIDDGDLAVLQQDLYEGWSDLLENSTGRYTSPRGVDLRPASNAGIGSYFTKLAGAGWSIGRELARGDRKKGLTPFGILQLALEDGDAEMLELWHEYEGATLGRSSVRWSRGLRDRFELEDSITDEDLAADDSVEEGTPQVAVDAEVWQRHAMGGNEWIVLEALEDWAKRKYKGEPPYGRVLDPEVLAAARRRRRQLALTLPAVA